jgi:hypothetical protein
MKAIKLAEVGREASAVLNPELRHEVATRQRLSGPAIRTFFNIARKWQLTTQQEQALLGWPARSTFFKMKKSNGAVLSFDTLERISLILGIYKALHILFPNEALANQWVRMANSNPLFGDQAPIELMTGSIDGLYQTRRLLDGRRA